jgi:hypothetical protein
MGFEEKLGFGGVYLAIGSVGADEGTLNSVYTLVYSKFYRTTDDDIFNGLLTALNCDGHWQRLRVWEKKDMRLNWRR